MRNYKRKGKTPWPDKDKRMAAAVRKRAEGKSLREIGAELAVSYQTVVRDLARWERDRPNVVPLSPKTVTSSCHNLPPAGRLVTPQRDSGESAPKLRRVQ